MDGNAARFGGMPELPMTAAHSDLHPTVIGQEAKDLADFRRHNGLTPADCSR